MTPKTEYYASIIKDLNKNWQPHNAQIQVGKALFNNNKRSVFLQCGRKFGKTELGIYILWRWALTNPESHCFYIAPLSIQAREIVWADPRIINFGNRDLVETVNNSEMRINFKNKSFIKIDGSDNFERHRGTRPHIIIYEEYKDHRPEFRNVMRPNLSVYNAPEIFLGTPDDKDGEYSRTADEHKNHPDKAYFEFTTYDNPMINKEWLESEKKRLYDRGEGDVFEREYNAKFIKGSSTKLFPMLDKSCVKPIDQILQTVHRDRKKLEWFVSCDPAAATCFGVLFGCINPYSKDIYILDEIYEKDQANMSVRQIGQRIIDKRNEYWQGDWRQVYDEASTWFHNEMLERFNEFFEPTQKSLNKKDNMLSLIKDALLAKKLTLSSKCTNLYFEMDNYYKDKSGNIPKKDDHLIDALRYLVASAYYKLEDVAEIQKEEEELWLEERRSFRSRQQQSEWENF